MKLRVYQAGSGTPRQQVAEFKLANPVRRKYPEWTPIAAPAVVKQGDLEIRFLRLLVGVNSDDPPGPPRPDEESMARADFGVTERSIPSAAWVPDAIEVRDATGNVARNRSRSAFVGEGYVYIRWDPYLWPNEAAWDLRVEFRRNEKGAFGTNELVEIKRLALPAVDGITETNLSTSRLGHSVRVLGLRNGAGRLGSRHMGGIGYVLEVEISPELERKRLTVVAVTDDQGREVTNASASRIGGSYTFGYRPKADAKELNFALAVQEVVIAEFRVKPEVFDASRAGKE